LVGRIKVNRPDSVFSMIFLTDGYNNDCPWNEVTKALKDLENDVVSSTFVEYGYYADSRKLTEMASILGGEKISTSNFDEYEPIFDRKISSSINGGKKSVVEITDAYLYDFAFSVGVDGSVLLYNIVDGKILVGSDVKEVHFFSSTAIGELSLPHYPKSERLDTALYAAIYVLADKLMNDDAERIFYALGDNHYYNMLANAFGKQKLNGFKTAIKECVADVSKRFPDGVAKIKKVDDNAYCLMNLIEDLGSIDGCLFYPSDSNFVYNRIGRKKVARGENLSDADKKRIAEAKNVEELSKITEEISEKNIAIKFNNSDPDRGYALTNLVWNEERANLSILIRIEGNATLPANKFKIDNIATYKYNTFTLVKDGIVNVDKLPVSYSKELYDHLTSKGIKFFVVGSVSAPVVTNLDIPRIVIDLASLPIVNRGMVKAVSANELAKQEWELLKLQANKKVYDYYRKSLFPKESKSFIELLTPTLGAEKAQECADWLKEVGITDFNGFAPKTDFEESTDFYMSVNLATKIKGLSSLPKVEDVVAKIASGAALKVSEWAMSGAIKAYQAAQESDIYKTLSEEQKKEALRTYLISKATELNIAKRKVMQEIAQIKFSLILSKKWFVEFKSFDENKLSLKLDGQDLEFTFDLSEKEEKI